MGFSFNFVRFCFLFFLILPVRLSLGFSLFSFFYICVIDFVCVCEMLNILLTVLLSQVVQDILEHEREFLKELQTVLNCYLRPLQSSDK